MAAKFTKVKPAKKGDPVSSEMDIKGGGKITSPDGFTVVVGGSTLDMKTGAIKLSNGGSFILIESGKITVHSDDIELNP